MTIDEKIEMWKRVSEDKNHEMASFAKRYSEYLEKSKNNLDEIFERMEERRRKETLETLTKLNKAIRNENGCRIDKFIDRCIAIFLPIEFLLSIGLICVAICKLLIK